MSKARNLSDFISDPAIDSTELGDGSVTTAKLHNQAVTPDKLHNTLDLSSKTVTLASDGISGNSVHGGVISDFASTGIDDNAASTAITIDSSGNVGVGTGSPSSSLHLANNTGTYLTIDSQQSTSSNGNASISLLNDLGTQADIIMHRSGLTQDLVFRNNVGGQGILFRTNGNNDRLYIGANGDVGIGTTSNIGVGSKLYVQSAGNALHVKSTNSNSDNIVSYSSSDNVAFKVRNDGSVYSGGSVEGSNYISTGLGRNKYFSSSWTNIFSISASSDKVFYAKIHAYNTENGAASHVTFYFSANIRHNNTPYNDFYSFSYNFDAELQAAAGSAYASFRFTNNGILNGDLYFQARNSTFGNSIYFYEIHAYPYNAIIWH